MVNLAAASSAWLSMIVGTYTDTSSQGIYSYRFNQETGQAELTAVTPAQNPSFVIFSEDRQCVYAVDESGTDADAAVAFRYEGINKPLQRLGQVPTGGKAPCNIRQVGDCVFTANYTGGSITEFRTDESGALKPQNFRIEFDLTGPAPDTARQQSAHLHCAIPSPDNKYLLACDLGNDCIYTFKIKDFATSKQPLHRFDMPAGSGPRHLTFSADGLHAYVITELSGEVMAFDYSDGQLTLRQTVVCDNLNAHGSADIHLSPDGRFLYASNRLKGDGITIYRVNKETGLLSYSDYQPTATHPRNFAITPNGRYLLCACRDSNVIQVFAINPATGSLTDTYQDINLPRPVCIAFE